MNHLNNTSRQQQGFTLIQVMAILGVLGLILTLATSAYLGHQSKHYIKEALIEAGQARQIVAQNAKSDVEASPKDWSKGYSPKSGENNAWSVSIDPTSAAVVVTILSSKEPATLLWLPLKDSAIKDESTLHVARLINESGINWICVVKEDAVPDSSRLFAPLSANIPTPTLAQELVSSDCR
jgi:type II secretory pathway pseudopilin PulG